MLVAVTPIAAKPRSRSRALAVKVLFPAFKALQEAGGSLPSSELKSRIAGTLDIDDWGREFLPKANAPRWAAVLHFFSIDCVKAGFLTKQRGVWSLTSEGEDALKLGPEGFLDLAMKSYREWRDKNPRQHPKEAGSEDEEIAADLPENNGSLDVAKLEEIEQTARDGLRRHIDAKNAYEFQDMVGALLRGMGYFTPFIAPRGKDGGIDLIAYKDPLGTIAPRIKVQVKHREQSASVQELRELTGILRRGDDVGIFVSTGGFSPDCQREARQSDRHIELIDFDRFIVLWQQFYAKMTDEDRLMLPLYTVHFLAPDE